MSSHFPPAGTSSRPSATPPSTRGTVPEARDGGVIELDVTVECHPGGAFARRQCRAQLRIGDHQRGQGGGRDRAGHQRLGGLLDHCAQVLDAAAGAAAVLGHRDTEQAEIGQAAENRPPGVRLALFDSPGRGRRAGR